MADQELCRGDTSPPTASQSGIGLIPAVPRRPSPHPRLLTPEPIRLGAGVMRGHGLALDCWNPIECLEWAIRGHFWLRDGLLLALFWPRAGASFSFSRSSSPTAQQGILGSWPHRHPSDSITHVELLVHYLLHVQQLTSPDYYKIGIMHAFHSRATLTCPYSITVTGVTVRKFYSLKKPEERSSEK